MPPSPETTPEERPASPALPDAAAPGHWNTAGCGGPCLLYAPHPCSATPACGRPCNPASPDGASPQTPPHGSSSTCSGSTRPSPPHPAPRADHGSSHTTSCPQTSACTRSTTVLQT